MYSLAKTVELFDATSNGWCCTDVQKPTETSITYINDHFGIQLPRDLIEFLTLSNLWSNWFAGLGEDYQHPQHIIRINSYYKNKRIRRNGQWQKAMPKELIVINRGFDDDCDCLDTSTLDSETGEYNLVYWYPNLTSSDITIRDSNFLKYINRQVIADSEHYLNDKYHNGKIRERSVRMAEKIMTILELPTT